MQNIDSYNFSTELTEYLKGVLENYNKMNLRSDVKNNLLRNNIESVKSIEEFIKLEGDESNLHYNFSFFSELWSKNSTIFLHKIFT